MRQFQYVLLSASLIYTLLSALIGWLVCDINFEGLINNSLRIINYLLFWNQFYSCCNYDHLPQIQRNLQIPSRFVTWKQEQTIN